VARALVGALREAGVNVKTGTLTISPRAGSHEAPLVTDLTAVEPVAVVATETAST
jgi:hypothetical protein